MRISKLGFLLFLICATNACIAADGAKADMALFKGQVESVSNLPDPPPPEGYLRIGGNVKARVHMTKVLVGAVSQKTFALVMRVASWPRTPFDAFFLVEKQSNGEMRVAWWDSELCMDQELSKKYGIEGAVKDLQREYPCSLSKP